MIRLLRHRKSNCHTSLIPILAVLLVSSPSADELKTRYSQHIFNLDKAENISLSMPSDVAVTREGRIYVVDGGNHRVVQYDADGEFVAVLGSSGTGEGQFSAPLGITVDRVGRIYVADTGNYRIQIFDANGRFLRQIVLQDKKEKIRPVDVAVSPAMDTIYVTGNNNHKVMLYSPQGKLKGQWGKQGNNPAEFRYPATLTVGDDGAVYVVDVLNSRVQIFETNGKLRTVAGSWGVLPGQLFRPKGVALDKHENIYVSDSYMDLVEVFDNATHFSHVLGEKGNPQKYTAPAGITIDDKNRIYVAEMLANRVSVYELE